jgi:Tfp pilus assembly protein PilN
MKKNPVNLVPAYRVAAGRWRRRRTRWLSAGAAYTALLATLYLAAWVTWGGGDSVLAEQKAEIEARTQQAKQAISTCQAELTQQEELLAAYGAVRDHPDWSVLLALLANRLDDEAVLVHCEVGPATASGPAGSAATAATEATSSAEGRATEAFTLRLAGYGRTVASVSRFALELERLGIFEQVRLLKTNREAFLACDAVRFQMECSLGASAETAR